MLTCFTHGNTFSTCVFYSVVIFLQIVECQDSHLHFVSSHPEGPQQYIGGVAAPPSSNPSDPLAHPGFVEYCQLSETAYSGNEGLGIPGYTLGKVLVVLSPGQRTLNVDFDNVTSPTISCDFEEIARSSRREKVKSFPEVADIYRHMRTKPDGFKFYKPYPSSATCQDEELSPLGSIQHILLGEYLSERYDELKLDEPYSNDWHSSAYSVHDEAIYQSLFAFLHGLLHEKNFVRLPVTKSLENFCAIYPNHSCSCPKSAYLLERISKGLRKGFFLFKDVVKVDQNINAKLLIPSNAEIAPRELVTFLSSWLCDARSNPCHHGNCLNVSHSTMDDVFTSANEYFNKITSSKIFRSFANLYTYPFFQRFFKWFESDEGQTLSVFAGEEEFLVAVLSVLGIPTEKVVPQASRIVFEIHESLDLEDDISILKIFHNGADVTGAIPVGKSRKSAVDLPSMKEFYSRTVLSNFRNENYFEECLS